MKTIIGLVLAVICLVCKPLMVEALNKAELIDAVAAETNLTKNDSRKAIDAVIHAFTNALKKGERVAIVGLGTFNCGKSTKGGKLSYFVNFEPGPDFSQSCSSLSPSATAPPPTVDIKAEDQNGTLSDGPFQIYIRNASRLSWTSTNATSCNATGDWSGSKPTSGFQSTGSLVSSKTFTLTCTGQGGSASDSVTVNVIATGGGGGVGGGGTIRPK